MNTLGFAYLHIENNRRDELLDDLSTAGFHSVLYDLFSFRSPFGFHSKIEASIFDQINLLSWLDKIFQAFQNKSSISINSIDEYPINQIDVDGIFPNLPQEYQKYDSKRAFWIFLLEKSGIVRSEEGNWTLSKAAEKAANDPQALLKILIEGIGFHINWSIFDGIAAKETGQLAFGTSLILLHKYGHEYRDVMFYTNKYFRFFELAREESHLENNQSEVDFINVYIYRTFYCFAQMFDFVELKETQTSQGIKTQVKTTPLFRSLFEFRM